MSLFLILFFNFFLSRSDSLGYVPRRAATFAFSYSVLTRFDFFHFFGEESLPPQWSDLQSAVTQPVCAASVDWTGVFFSSFWCESPSCRCLIYTASVETDAPLAGLILRSKAGPCFRGLSRALSFFFNFFSSQDRWRGPFHARGL